MAIFHCQTTPICRSKGHSSVANSAYIGAKELTDERIGKVYDYTKKGGVLANEIVLPEGIEQGNLTSSNLWNLAEKAENRADARVGREWEISLPHELSISAKIILAKELTKNIANRFQVAAEFAIHEPSREGSDERNYHVHILTSTRKINANLELTEKSSIELDRKQCASLNIPNSAEQMIEVRGMVASTINQHLEQANVRERISHKSLREQGIDRTPGIHKGKIRTEIERRALREEKALEGKVERLEKIIATITPAKEIDPFEDVKKLLANVKMRSGQELLDEIKAKEERELNQQQEQKQKMSRELGFGR